MTLTPEALGSGLSAVIGNVELWFDCDCSNVLVVAIKWSHYHPATTTCTVDIEKEASAKPLCGKNSSCMCDCRDREWVLRG